jgi:hypothetical protein
MIQDTLSLTLDAAHPCLQNEPLETIEVIELPEDNLWELLDSGESAKL